MTPTGTARPCGGLRHRRGQRSTGAGGQSVSLLRSRNANSGTLRGADREATELLEVVTLPADEACSGAISEGPSALVLLMAEPLVRGLRV
jgi:hypothetical protein